MNLNKRQIVAWLLLGHFIGETLEAIAMATCTCPKCTERRRYKQ